MITGVTKSGFKYNIPEGLTNDFLFLKAYRNVISGDDDRALDGAAELVSVLFADKKEEDRFYRHLGKSHGSRVPMDVMFSEISEILTSVMEKDGTAKNL